MERVADEVAERAGVRGRAAEGERQARGDFRLRHTLQVRFRDCDPMRHANNAVYFTYLEQARFFLEQRGRHVVVNRLPFLQSLRHDPSRAASVQ